MHLQGNTSTGQLPLNLLTSCDGRLLVDPPSCLIRLQDTVCRTVTTEELKLWYFMTHCLDSQASHFCTHKFECNMVNQIQEQEAVLAANEAAQ